MKTLLIIICLAICIPAFSQKTVHLGFESDTRPLEGVIVSDSLNRILGYSDARGVFSVNSGIGLVKVSHVGYKSQVIDLSNLKADTLKIELEEDQIYLEEIEISTGYQTLSKERITGSFTKLNPDELNMVSGYDLLTRLEGNANGLVFDRSGLYKEDQNGKPSLRIRGVNTLFADTEPLIILDNFPYEGNIENINPNDVASVTLLKDASAASIWGSQAANGVIVINTKKGLRNTPLKVSYTASAILTERPDLRYNPNFISSKDYLSIERELFNRGVFMPSETKAFTPAVHLWQQVKDGQLAESDAEAIIKGFESADVIDDAYRYLYQNGLNMQYAINLSGGTQKHNYYYSLGYDDQSSIIRNNDSKRLTLNLNERLDITNKLSLNLNLSYTQHTANSNGLTLSDLETAGIHSIYPYAKLADADGHPLSIPRDFSNAFKEEEMKNGLLDWNFYPLLEMKNKDQISKDNEFRINSTASYQLNPYLNIDLLYQYQNSNGTNTLEYDEESYYARNLINQFTQADGRLVIPMGGVYSSNNSNSSTHAGRGQINYNRSFSKNEINAITGAEIREIQSVSYPETLLYGYSPDLGQGSNMLDYTAFYIVRPFNYSLLPGGGTRKHTLVDRYLSYYANIGYSLLSRYNFTASSRWDGSNLYGVNTNQKGVPLWHLGASWTISNEEFFDIKAIDYLKLRLTYGSAGNTVKNITAYPVYTYVSQSIDTGLPYGILRTSANPDLRWEKTNTLNLGIDFSIFNSRINASLDAYTKKAIDLIGDIEMDPTTGIVSRSVFFMSILNRINYASTKTLGLDFQINSMNTIGRLKWETQGIYNYARNTVIAYNGNSGLSASSYLGASIPVVGKSINSIYSYPWYGLSKDNGNPLIPTENGGFDDKNYGQYLSSLNYDDLIYHGSTIPLHTISLRNNFSYKNFSLSFNLLFKGGFYFKRSGMGYSGLFNNATVHKDYLNRWQKSGDEQVTHVPSLPSSIDLNRENLYMYSSALVEKGDNLRLQDIGISYEFSGRNGVFQTIKPFINCRNTMILWRATKTGLDPDFPNTRYPAQRIFSLGLNVNFN